MPTLLHRESRLRVALGTFIAIDAQANDRHCAMRGVEAAFDAVTLVERLMHPTRLGSDLAALAECRSGRRLRVHPWTFEVLELCQRVHEVSNGMFDPCVDLAPGRMTDLELTAQRDLLPHAHMRIDLGGIAKGYAVDRAIDALRDAGCNGGLVNAGGDLAVFGERRHEIICRTAAGFGAAIELRDTALATSDTRQPARPREHRGYYHGRDRNAAVAGAVTVTAQKAAVADALTKCLLLGERGLNATLLATFNARQIHLALPVAA